MVPSKEQVGSVNHDGDKKELSLLGGFVFSVGGDALLGVSTGSQKLLAFLAERDRVNKRAKVAGVLWPESTESRAGANLRSAVSRLEGPARKAVDATPSEISLTSEVELDVRDARALARRLTDLDAAPSAQDIRPVSVEMLSDDLLPGWYDDWAVIAAEDWNLLRTHALEAVAARLTEGGRLAEAAAAAYAAIRAEPLRESARAALIRVQMAEGNQALAVGEFERYRVLLEAELGLEPTTRLSALLPSLKRR